MWDDLFFWNAVGWMFLSGIVLKILAKRPAHRAASRPMRTGKMVLKALFVCNLLIAAMYPMYWYCDEDSLLYTFLLLPFAGTALLCGFIRYNRQRPDASRNRVVAGNLVVLVCILSFLPAILELYGRFFRDATDSMNFTKASVRWSERYMRQNALGYADNVEYTNTAVMSGKRRITLLGDSFAAGYGVKRVSDRLVGQLRATHPQWEFHNLAVPAFDTPQQIASLSNYFNAGFSTDDVLLVYCLNDALDMVPNWNYKVGRKAMRPPPKWGWLFDNSYFANTFYYRMRVVQNPEMKLENYHGFVFGGYEGEIWEKQKMRLSALRNLAVSHGSRFSVATFPFVHSLGPAYRFASIHQTLDHFWRELGVPHLDLLPAYEGIASQDLVVNRFDAHPNELAHRLAAKRIGGFLGSSITPAR